MHHQRGSLVPIGDAASELDVPVPDEKFALELLSDHLAMRGVSEFQCKVNEADPPDLVVTWDNGVSVALQRVGAKRQEVQVFHFLCCVQCVQKKFNPGSPLRVDPPVVSIFKRPPKDLRSEPLDHKSKCNI